MPKSDQMWETAYDKWYKCHDDDKEEVARIALLAVEHRLQQLQQKRMRRAIERRAAERRTLKNPTGASRDQSPVGEGCLSLSPYSPGQQEQSE